MTKLSRLLRRLPSIQTARPLPNTHDLLRLIADLPTCGALQTRAEVSAASTLVHLLGLPSHHDPQKNWDTLKAISYVLRYASTMDPVLDAGSGRQSVILKWLQLLGFTHLYACDVRASSLSETLAKDVQFSIQDLVSTTYPDGFFRAITCISVIEHGVDPAAYLREMSRILRPGGVLLTSTDYWSEPIDCEGIFPYGPEMPEMKVFQAHEIVEICSLATQYGLHLCRPLHLETNEPAVTWKRVNRSYTFAFFALEKATAR